MTLDDPQVTASTGDKKSGLQTITTAQRVARDFNPQALQDRMYGAGAAAPVAESRRVVLCLMKSTEVEIVVDELMEEYAEDDSFIVEDAGTFYRLENDEGFEIDLDVIEPLIGHRYDVFDFMVNVTTTIGRAYNDGNKFVMTTKMMGLEEELPRFQRGGDDESDDLNHMRGAGGER
ncbi:MmoB/DmpM family protein (plasmid) [Mycolicibacterium chubuense NBB4]|uniref:MmoB/DmpM family protein n=2 Tax=Mycolicibacterium TaxID=1866885 RepID=D2K2D0_MYCCN|nr:MULTISPECIES: MmoB/DmpM family protein [Mycolicibacterium]ACZ56336.1 putative soluble di-iron monooxygenase coupling protein [Mycolicibacterium chubuense NBB4]AFM20508.1 MmoB/DmpM family protein [Mycolicibacterium chubuense NBB4]NTY63976.1 MmoB/DmpM family protein [Mycolicibacterium sphagni]